jgi:hypothetical protein
MCINRVSAREIIAAQPMGVGERCGVCIHWTWREGALGWCKVDAVAVERSFVCGLFKGGTRE